MAGCKYQTPDGIALYRGDTVAQVDRKLGAPDLVEPASANLGSCIFKDFRDVNGRYYFDRKQVYLFDRGRLADIRGLDDDRIGDLERRARIYREMEAIVPEGTPLSTVMQRLGQPCLVDEMYTKVGLDRSQSVPAVREESLDHREIWLYYPEREVAIQFVKRVSGRILPLDQGESQRVRERLAAIERHTKLLAEDPPRVGMSEATLRERWGSPEVVSGVVWGREMYTPAWDDPKVEGDSPAERLGTEVTSWYYIDREKIVRISVGAVFEIEPLPASMRAKLQHFHKRAWALSGTGPLQERIR